MQVKLEDSFLSISRENSESGVIDDNFVEDDVGAGCAIAASAVVKLGPFAFRRNIDLHAVDGNDGNAPGRIEKNPQIDLKGEPTHDKHRWNIRPAFMP